MNWNWRIREEHLACDRRSSKSIVSNRLPIHFGWPLFTFALASGGCAGPQSTLSPAGFEAEKIAILFWVMAVGAGVIWITVSGLAYYALRIAPHSHDEIFTRRWVIGGGAIAPTIVLGILLVFALQSLPALLRPASHDSMHIEAVSAQWWWRFSYPTPDGGTVEVANEVRLPVGEPVQFELESVDVIHSFWIPSLGGKIDMIPGRRTHLTLLPNKVGTYRGVCAEYCGESHAHMAFDVVVTTQADFDDWLKRQVEDSAPPQGSEAALGAEVFRRSGCGACHAIRGTSADGTIGPDLTHIGGRLSLAAGTMKNTEENLLRWITHPKRVKPGAAMPNFQVLSSREIEQLAVYLKGLQ